MLSFFLYILILIYILKNNITQKMEGFKIFLYDFQTLLFLCFYVKEFCVFLFFKEKKLY